MRKVTSVCDGNMFVSSCDCWMLVPSVQSVGMRSAVFGIVSNC